MQGSPHHPSEETGLPQLSSASYISLAELSVLGRHLKREVVWVDGDDVCHGEEDAFPLPGNRRCSARANGCEHLCRGRATEGAANAGLLGGPHRPTEPGVPQLLPQGPPQRLSGEMVPCPLPCQPQGPCAGPGQGRALGESSARCTKGEFLPCSQLWFQSGLLSGTCPYSVDPGERLLFARWCCGA